MKKIKNYKVIWNNHPNEQSWKQKSGNRIDYFRNREWEKSETESLLKKIADISLELEEKLDEEKNKLIEDIRSKEEILTQNKQIFLNKNDLKLVITK